MNIKKFVRIDTRIKEIVRRFFSLSILLSCLLILACTMIDEDVKRNIEISAYKMGKEGTYPRYLVENMYYQLDNWTEAEILNFIYSAYENDALKTAFAQRSISGNYQGKVPWGDLERLLSHVEGNSDLIETVRPSYWIGYRIILIPLLKIMDYYSIRTLLFCIALTLLGLTILIVSRKVCVKLGLCLFGAFIMINFPIAFLNNSLGLLCMCLTLIAIIWFVYHKDTEVFKFMFTVGMLTAYFEWFSLSIFSFGMVTVVLLVLKYLENPETEFVVFFNKIWNSAFGWLGGIISMLGVRIVVSTLLIGPKAIEHFMHRFTYNIGVQGEESLLFAVIRALGGSILGIFPVSIVFQTGSKLMLIVTLIILFLMCVGILVVAVKSTSKRSLSCSLFLTALSPIVWIVFFHCYYVVHFCFAYRVLGISAFAVLCILLFGLDVGSKSYGRKKES